MMKYIWIIFSICFVPLWMVEKEAIVAKEKPVAELLQVLGDRSLTNLPNTAIKGVSVENGKRLFFEGFSSRPNGKKTKKQSKHFVCTSCHNVVREDPDLSVTDPQARLVYAKENELPFLQGTTMYGAVNRTSFYNGDYYKKY
ncbi:MAG: hypothetical protein AAGJ18_05425, partial [Bacteroidota bacterium]